MALRRPTHRAWPWAGRGRRACGLGTAAGTILARVAPLEGWTRQPMRGNALMSLLKPLALWGGFFLRPQGAERRASGAADSRSDAGA